MSDKTIKTEKLIWRPNGTIVHSMFGWKRECPQVDGSIKEEPVVICAGVLDDGSECPKKNDCMSYDDDILHFLKKLPVEEVLEHTEADFQESVGISKCHSCNHAMKCRDRGSKAAMRCKRYSEDIDQLIANLDEVREGMYGQIYMLINDMRICEGLILAKQQEKMKMANIHKEEIIVQEVIEEETKDIEEDNT